LCEEVTVTIDDDDDDDGIVNGLKQKKQFYLVDDTKKEY